VERRRPYADDRHREGAGRPARVRRGGPARENRECHRPAAPGLHGRAQASGKGELAAGDRAAYYAGFRDAMEALLAGEYADRVSSDGIRLERYILLAVADKR